MKTVNYKIYSSDLERRVVCTCWIVMASSTLVVIACGLYLIHRQKPNKEILGYLKNGLILDDESREVFTFKKRNEKFKGRDDVFQGVQQDNLVNMNRCVIGSLLDTQIPMRQGDGIMEETVRVVRQWLVGRGHRAISQPTGNRCSLWAALFWSILMAFSGLYFCIQYDWSLNDVPLFNRTWSRGFLRHYPEPFRVGSSNKVTYVCSGQLSIRTGSERDRPTSRSRIVSKNLSSPDIASHGVFQGTPFEDLFHCSKLSTSTNNIFFLETSCAANQKFRTPGRLTLTAKQACSVYSAAYHHPSRKVNLLLTCPLASQFYKWTKPYMKALLELPNVYFGYVDLEEFYANTSLLEFYRQHLVYSKYPTAQNSDLLRLYLLYVYGGTYMDLDAISLRALDDLGVNFIGQESNVSVANGILSFEPNHEFLRKLLFRGLTTYDATKWTSLGPELFTTCLLLFCNLRATGNLERSEACNIKILPVDTFYSVKGDDWPHFYNASLWPKMDKMLNGSYVAHYWNHEGSFPLTIGSDQPIIKLAQDHCTNIYKTLTLVME